MVSNQDVQNEFEKFLDGEQIEWQLLKMFFHQNGGFSRKLADDNGDVDSAIGMTVNRGKITVSLMDIQEKENGLYAQEDDAVSIQVDGQIKNRLIEMVKNAADYDFVREMESLEEGSDDSEDKPDEMYA